MALVASNNSFLNNISRWWRPPTWWNDGAYVIIYYFVYLRKKFYILSLVLCFYSIFEIIYIWKSCYGDYGLCAFVLTSSSTLKISAAFDFLDELIIEISKLFKFCFESRRQMVKQKKTKSTFLIRKLSGWINSPFARLLRWKLLRFFIVFIAVLEVWGFR